MLKVCAFFKPCATKIASKKKYRKQESILPNFANFAEKKAMPGLLNSIHSKYVRPKIVNFFKKFRDKLYRFAKV